MVKSWCSDHVRSAPAVTIGGAMGRVWAMEKLPFFATYCLLFFCAGAPSRRGAARLVRRLGATRAISPWCFSRAGGYSGPRRWRFFDSVPVRSAPRPAGCVNPVRGIIFARERALLPRSLEIFPDFLASSPL